jgi:hypothetical protein
VSSKLIEKFWPTDAARAEKGGTAEPGEDAGPAESAEKTE